MSVPHALSALGALAEARIEEAMREARLEGNASRVSRDRNYDARLIERLTRS